MGSVKKPRNQLNQNEKFKLYEFLKDKQEQIAERKMSQTEVGSWATGELGFTVTGNNVAGIMNSKTNAALPFVWAKGGVRENSLPKEVRLMSEIITELCEELGANDRIRGKIEQLKALQSAAEQKAAASA
jgi:hypothetical protein